jgi:hypothetical protein
MVAGSKASNVDKGSTMKTLLYAGTTLVLLAAGHLSPAMAAGPKASIGNNLTAWSVMSDTTARTIATPSFVRHQIDNNARPSYELDPELQRIYDDVMRRAGVPLSKLR